jgi:hypothetical protein
MILIRRQQDFHFIFEDAGLYNRKYGETEKRGIPVSGRVQVITENQNVEITASVQGPLANADGTPRKGGVYHWLDAPDLEEEMTSFVNDTFEPFGLT